MSGFKRRRDPDPSRPGTVYRSKPSLGRKRSLKDGPPYLEGGVPVSAQRARASAGAGHTPGSGLGSVDQIYAENGGDYQAGSEYGNRYDSANDPHGRGPG